ncbi:hypothetical protein BD414DRAFT_280056 [Trametes punicea]|nr:hypothetical protein BD414DRAFT_280056 [Trametes punicea]
MASGGLATTPEATGMASPSLDSTIGALALGTFISLILYGVSVHQLYQYLRQFPSEKWTIKSVVIGVMILETLQTIAPIHACYYYLVRKYDRPDAIQTAVWSLNIIPGIAAFIVLVSESFFARRVALIGRKSQVLAAFAVLCLLVGNALSLAIAVKAFQIMNIIAFGEKTHAITSVSLALNALADYLLSGAIIVALRASRASHAKSSKLEVATLYILNTGLLTGILQGLAAIMAIRYPLKLYWGAVGLVAMRMYGITLLSILNSRRLLVSRGIKVFNNEGFGRNIIARANRLVAVEQWNVPQVSDDTMMPPVINVKVAAETEVHGESGDDLPIDLQRKGLGQSSV